MTRLALVAAFALTLAGCGSTSSDQPTDAASDTASDAAGASAKPKDNMAVAGPDTPTQSPSAGNRHDGETESEPQLDDNGNPIPTTPGGPTAEEIRQAAERMQNQQGQ